MVQMDAEVLSSVDNCHSKSSLDFSGKQNTPLASYSGKSVLHQNPSLILLLFFLLLFNPSCNGG